MINKYYDGTKLLSMKDRNSETPEIFLVSGNRTAGKTTYFNRLAINRFLKKREKFLILYRYKNELKNVSEKFFKDIKNLFFEEYDLISNSKEDGVYYELELQKKIITTDGKLEIIKEPCGYATALNVADSVKKLSHLMNDCNMIVFDEFQSETNNYCSQELKKFISIHTSLARGNGKQVRYLPVYMMSNNITLLNPYFIGLGISDKLNKNTKFLRGEGFVLEQNFNQNAAKAQKESAFNRAFAGNRYVDYAAEGVYLNDNSCFIEKINGVGVYNCTIIHKNKKYSIKTFKKEGIIYCDDKIDPNFPVKLALTTEDHRINYVMIEHNKGYINLLREYYLKGCFRFKNLSCKSAIMKMLSY